MTTTRLVEWFEKEAGGFLSLLERDAASLAYEPLALNAMCAAARALSGAARLAGDDRVHRAASALDAGMRASTVDGGTVVRLTEDIRLSVDDLRFLLDGRNPERELDARADVVVARWSDSIPPGPKTEPGPPAEDFSIFAIREADGVAETMESGISAFMDDPSNREWLGAILRRQRTLLGSARLETVPVLAETLHAVEDLCELIVRLGVPVKSEWLDVFRCARDVLRNSAATLSEGEEPGQTPSLSRLRTLHEELTARYGERVASQAAEPPGSQAASEPAPAPAPDPRQRAVVLRAEIAQALGDAPGPREALDELYGLLLSALR